MGLFLSYERNKVIINYDLNYFNFRDIVTTIYQYISSVSLPPAVPVSIVVVKSVSGISSVVVVGLISVVVDKSLCVIVVVVGIGSIVWESGPARN